MTKPFPDPRPPVEREDPSFKPMPSPRPNPGKFKKFEAQPGGVDDSMETKVNPTQPMDNTLVSKVGEQMVPDTKRKTKKKTNNTGALGSSGGYL